MTKRQWAVVCIGALVCIVIGYFVYSAFINVLPPIQELRATIQAMQTQIAR